MKKELFSLCVNSSDSIISVLKKMDLTKRKLLIVINNFKYYSLISIGDIQRAIINNIDLNQSVSTILRENVKVAHSSDDLSEIKRTMLKRRNEFMPIINEDNDIVDVILWDTLFSEKHNISVDKLNLPVVIMAGGKGTRLAPLTNVLPKPLIPIGDKTIIENIMDRFVGSGCSEFYISLNYKADMIKYYFESINNLNYRIHYFQERKPLGTAGSLHLLKEKIATTFFVSNCDIIVDQDYAEVLRYHRENKNELTMVAAIKDMEIPYGTIQTKENGLVDYITEKPVYNFKINTGLYILEPHLIKEIPIGTFFHITNLIEKLYKENRRVGVFPISEGSWIDIGNWDEYLKSFRSPDNDIIC
ncbi:MAG: nucleotidyltransferase family protein [Candidatus Margulisbacteria bacterium]|nr:nucleotidyltransferase family protein [Candidatus Margulisiibacteriota bacterium]